MNYRKDIQILRGLSVLFVVLYHLEFNFLESGFLGVDIFFVISGFLMAVLYKDPKTSFYYKRAKRLLPAYFTVIFFTVITCYFITLPNDFAKVREQVNFASVLSSNIGYWQENSYFSKANFTPLLHLWSLGVELQFYLLVPFLFPLIRKSTTLLIIVFFTSLISCLLMTEISPKTSFFMMPTRIWEFLLGFIAATYFTNEGNIKYHFSTITKTIVFLPIIVIPFISVQGDIQNFIFGHPGLTALIVSTSTAGFLAIGLPTGIEGSRIARLFEKLGKYSYSIYLTHFPILALYSYQPFTGTTLSPHSLTDLLCVLIITLISSIALYKIVEERLANSQYIKVILAISPIVLLTLTFSLTAIQQSQYTDNENEILRASMDRGIYRCGKIFRIVNPTSKICNVGNINSENDEGILLIGNSHADAIKDRFSELANDSGVKLYITISNNPLAKGGLTENQIIDQAKENNISKIALHYSPNSSIKQSSIESLARKAKVEDISVYYILPIPVWEESVPKILWRNLPQKNTMVKNNYHTNNLKLIKSIEKIQLDNFHILNTEQYFCNNGLCSISNQKNKPLYFDSNHLTLTGSLYLEPIFRHIISN
jgi:peptidoglycan/LPS O-acetylase OafA/YrhL